MDATRLFPVQTPDWVQRALTVIDVPSKALARTLLWAEGDLAPSLLWAPLLSAKDLKVTELILALVQVHIAKMGHLQAPFVCLAIFLLCILLVRMHKAAMGFCGSPRFRHTRQAQADNTVPKNSLNGNRIRWTAPREFTARVRALDRQSSERKELLVWLFVVGCFVAVAQLLPGAAAAATDAKGWEPPPPLTDALGNASIATSSYIAHRRALTHLSSHLASYEKDSFSHIIQAHMFSGSMNVAAGTDLQALLDACPMFGSPGACVPIPSRPGLELVLDDGTYTGSGDNVLNLEFKSPPAFYFLSIRAKNPGQVVLDGQNVRRVIKTSLPFLILSGVNITNGFASDVLCLQPSCNPQSRTPTLSAKRRCHAQLSVLGHSPYLLRVLICQGAGIFISMSALYRTTVPILELGDQNWIDVACNRDSLGNVEGGIFGWVDGIFSDANCLYSHSDVHIYNNHATRRVRTVLVKQTAQVASPVRLYLDCGDLMTMSCLLLLVREGVSLSTNWTSMNMQLHMLES